ncbi:MAG: hypothetical protein AAF430_01465 [Myxococcota bacterium]
MGDLMAWILYGVWLDGFEFLSNNADTVIALAQFFLAGMIGLFTIYAYIYSRRRDKLQFFHNNWNKQQDINLQCLVNDDVLKIVEGLIYGPDHEVDVQEARAFTFAFLHLNKIQNNFEAMSQRVISRREYVEMSLPTLRLFARSKNLICYLVEQRGYSPEFRDSVVELIADLDPLDPPPFMSEIPALPREVSGAVPAIEQASVGAAADRDSELAPEQVSSLVARFNKIVMKRVSPLARPLLAAPVTHLASVGFLLNPILLGAQLYRAITTSPAGLSPAMFGGFAALNLLTALAAIRTQDALMFLSFALSFVISLSIFGLIVV